MQTDASNSESIDAYISGFPPEVQTLLQQLRQTIQKAAPSAVEAISYQIPTFKLHGNLVYFAKYKSAKGSVQFPLDQPLPLALVAKIVRFRVTQNLAKAAVM